MDYFEKIVTLVTSHDRSVVKTGISLLQSLDEVTYYDKLLEGIFPNALSDGVLEKRSLSNEYFTLNPEKQRSLLDVISVAPQTCKAAEDLRQAITKIVRLDYIPESLSSFPNLHSLFLYESDTITDLGALVGVHSLERVSLRNCSALKDISALNTLPNLKTISIWDCNKIETVNISGSPVEQVEISSAASIREFSFTNCDDLSSVEINSLHNLADLILTGNPALRTFQARRVRLLKNIKIASNITSLELEGAEILNSLDFLSGLVSLGSVTLVKLPKVHTLGPLQLSTDMTHLRIQELEELTDLSALESLSRLEKIDIRNCPRLKEVRSLSAITGPAELYLSNLPLVDLSCLHRLQGFSSICLYQIGTLVQLPSMEELSQLESLILNELGNLVDASTLQGLTGIQNLTLRNLPVLSDLTPVGACSSLIDLTLINCPSISSIAPLSTLPNLRSLGIYRCDQIIDLTPLLQFAELDALELGIDGDTVNYEVLRDMKGARSLNFRDSWNIRLEKLKRIKLNIPQCTIIAESGNTVSPSRSRPGTMVQFTSPTEKRQFRKIRDLICSKSDENIITGISLLQSLQNERMYQELLRDLSTYDGHYIYASYREPSLTNKYFSRSEVSQRALFLTLASAPVTFLEIQKVRDPITRISHTLLPEDLSGFTNVVSLHTEVTGAKNLAAIGRLTKVTELRLSSCHELEDITALADLTEIESIGLHGCSKLTDLTPLSKLLNLKKLSLSGFAQLTDVSPLAALPNLTELSLAGFTKLTDVSPLAALPNLTELSLAGFEQLIDISPIGKISNLETLSLEGFSQLSDIAAIADLQKLKNFKISELAKINYFGGLERASMLEDVTISDCCALNEVRIQGLSTSLQNVAIHGCSIVKKITISHVQMLRNISFKSYSWRCKGISEIDIDLEDLPSLEKVSIHNNQIENVRFQNLGKVTSMGLGSVVSSCNLAEISNLSNLETLSLTGRTNDYSFITNLRRFRDLTLTGYVSPSAFETLRGSKLEDLWISESGLSLADARKIKKILPNCKIHTRTVTL